MPKGRGPTLSNCCVGVACVGAYGHNNSMVGVACVGAYGHNNSMVGVAAAQYNAHTMRQRPVHKLFVFAVLM